MKILETERLLLRGLEQGDFKDVCKLLQDDEVMYAYEGAFNDQEVQNWLDRQFGRYRHDGFGLWGVVEKGSNELIGQCGITYQEFDGKRVPEIGYLFRKEFWHKGFAIEAAVACREYAFHTLGLFDHTGYQHCFPKSSAAQWHAKSGNLHKALPRGGHAAFCL